MREATILEDKDLGPLLDRIAALEARVKQLESERAVAAAARSDGTAAVAGPVAPAAVAPTAPAPREEISPEIVMVISAAIAAFMGKRPHIRQIRLIGSDTWAQQGRVSIMASHLWAAHRT
jgi:methylmalonyl-CoA carboxyltransferase large subunit